MRVMVTMSIVVLSMACGSERVIPGPLLSPSQVGADGVYVISRRNYFGPPTPPCATYLSGISQNYLDSARVVFDRDGTATPMAATSSSLCEVGKPCVSSKRLI